MTRNILIGKLISEKIAERKLQMEALAKQLEIPEPVLSLMLKNDDLGCNVLFKLSRILEYDFFRYYSRHLKHSLISENGTESNAGKDSE